MNDISNPLNPASPLNPVNPLSPLNPIWWDDPSPSKGEMFFAIAGMVIVNIAAIVLFAIYWIHRNSE